MSETLGDLLNGEKFSAFATSEAKERFYLKQKWNLDNDEKYLELLITDCTCYWSGCYTKAELEQNSNLSNFDVDGIQKEFEKAFSKQSEEMFLIELRDSEDFTHKFLKLKKVLEDEIKVEIAALSLEIIDGDPKEIFNYTLDYIEKLETKLLKLNKDFNRLSSERSEALSDLAVCVEQKDQIENDLYSKFLCILNEKKKKIRELSSALGSTSS